MDITDDERPTMPALPRPRAFDTQTEIFLSDVPTLPEFVVPQEDLARWWQEQRRRTFRPWVAAAVALCVGLVAAALFVGSA